VGVECDPIDYAGPKTSRTTYKNIVWYTKNTKMTSLFNIKIIAYWIDLGQYGLTCQICDSGYETMIIS
jgi:hypothetical protein